MSSIGNPMLLEALNSLKESRIELQRQLAQRPEYRALLVIDRAALQLAEPFDPPSASASAHPETAARGDPGETPIVAQTTETVAEIDSGECCVPDAAIETSASTDGPAETLSPVVHLEDPVEKALVPARAPAEEPAKASARAIDLFLSSTAQTTAPIESAPPPRRYLPFIATPRPFKTASAN
jgi:hypothetical protein